MAFVGYPGKYYLQQNTATTVSITTHDTANNGGIYSWGHEGCSLYWKVIKFDGSRSQEYNMGSWGSAMNYYKTLIDIPLTQEDTSDLGPLQVYAYQRCGSSFDSVCTWFYVTLDGNPPSSPNIFLI
jgi:hypothetical protein